VQKSYLLQGKPTNDRIGIDPLLGLLIDNGEAGYGHFPLMDGSPLIDAGGRESGNCSEDTDGTAFDQIGQPRVDGNGDQKRECDIGAIEFQVPAIAPD
jgi:hypothetical protein